MCGHAVNDKGEWITDKKWMEIYDEVVASGERVA
jgi:hypothetical protein